MPCTEAVEPVEGTVDFRLPETGLQELFAQHVLIRIRLGFEILLGIRLEKVHEHVKNGFAHFVGPSSLC